MFTCLIKLPVDCIGNSVCSRKQTEHRSTLHTGLNGTYLQINQWMAVGHMPQAPRVINFCVEDNFDLDRRASKPWSLHRVHLAALRAHIGGAYMRRICRPPAPPCSLCREQARQRRPMNNSLDSSEETFVFGRRAVKIAGPENLAKRTDATLQRPRPQRQPPVCVYHWSVASPQHKPKDDLKQRQECVRCNNMSMLHHVTRS
ncbi:hypothetical protein LXA43DRAFT_1017097 [Ganoderma leucocontextum]|nr:hypothetical protein LXA43DRAFT_1017097 [Ganoderma leucocontextum]